METMIEDERTLNELDRLRLMRVVRDTGATAGTSHGLSIDAVLDAADVVSPRDVPADVVTMQSRVLLADLNTGRRYELTLCYPADAEPTTGFVSVLSPVGASLLGLRVGAVARWRTPSGDEGAAEVLALFFQPEASGDYTL